MKKKAWKKLATNCFWKDKKNKWIFLIENNQDEVLAQNATATNVPEPEFEENRNEKEDETEEKKEVEDPPGPKENKKRKKSLQPKPENYKYIKCILHETLGCLKEGLFKRVGMDENPFVCVDHQSAKMQFLWHKLVDISYQETVVTKAFRMEQVYGGTKGRCRIVPDKLAPKHRKVSPVEKSNCAFPEHNFINSNLYEQLQESKEIVINLECVSYCRFGRRKQNGGNGT